MDRSGSGFVVNPDSFDRTWRRCVGVQIDYLDVVDVFWDVRFVLLSPLTRRLGGVVGVVRDDLCHALESTLWALSLSGFCDIL